MRAPRLLVACGRAGDRLARFTVVVLVASLALARAPAADDATPAWAALAAGGHVALIRHGNAPGPGGDPVGARIDDCRTQRTLDDRGRGQARALGEAFRSRGVRVDRVESSPWCRCIDTARLMAVGPVETSWTLAPVIAGTPNAAAALSALGELVSTWRGPGTLVLVTHGLTVRAMTGILPSQAETLVLRPTPGSGSGADVIGRIPPPR